MTVSSGFPRKSVESVTAPIAGDVSEARCAGQGDPITRVGAPALMGRYAGADRRSGPAPMPTRSCACMAAARAFHVAVAPEPSSQRLGRSSRRPWRPSTALGRSLVAMSVPVVMVRRPSSATHRGGAVGAKTGLLIYADGEVSGLLRQVGAADLEQTSVMMRRLDPSCEIEESDGSKLYEGVYPPDGTAYAASWPGVEIVCDRRVMIDSPSQLPGHLVDTASTTCSETTRRRTRSDLGGTPRGQRRRSC